MGGQITHKPPYFSLDPATPLRVSYLSVNKLGFTSMQPPRNHLFLSFLLFLLSLFTGCSPDEQVYFPATKENAPQENIRILSVHPLHNPVRLYTAYQPIIDLLNQEAESSGSPTRFQLEASLSYEDYDKKLELLKHDFSLPNPYQTVQCIRDGHYNVIGKMGDDSIFCGIILVRKDSSITSPSQLEGKKITFPAPTALAACMMPIYFLHSFGISPGKNYEPVFSGSHESSIMQVYLGQTAAGCTWPPPWKLFQRNEPEKAAELEVRWETPPLTNVSIVARSDVSNADQAIVKKVFFNLHKSEEGKKILAEIGLPFFEPASDSDYTKVSDFLKEYYAAFPSPLSPERPKP